MSKRVNRIVIIGAGIAGLAAANAFEQLGFNVCVVEKSAHLDNIGGGILLWPKAQLLLESLHLGNALKQYAVEVQGGHYFDQYGQFFIRREFNTLNEKIGGSILPLERNLLQRMLMENLQQTNVAFNHYVVSIEQLAPEQYQVNFANGEKIPADLVIVADGMYSATRTTQFSHMSLKDTGFSWWGGILEKEQAIDLPADDMASIFGVGKVCVVWPLSDGRQMWYLALNEAFQKNKKADKNRAHLIARTAGWSDWVTHIVTQEFNENNFYQAVAEVNDIECLHRNNIVLTGDAAHGFGPLLGLGAGEALEDIFVLAHLCKNYEHDIALALSKYTEIRLPDLTILKFLENKSATDMITDDEQKLDLVCQTLKDMPLEQLYQALMPFVNVNKVYQQVATLKSCYEETVTEQKG